MKERTPESLGTGRIKDIIRFLKEESGEKNATDIKQSRKISIFSRVLGLNLQQIDELIAENPPVLRTIKGHIFETFFDTLIKENGYEVTELGGDQSIDRIVNGYSLQLKTPNKSGTRNNFVQYKTHKTHGAKSEKESIDYYHRVDKFPDFLVGLISYQPLNIVFISRDELPRVGNSLLHIMSPFKIDWKTHPGTNSFERINVIISGKFTNKLIASKNESLPKTCLKLKLCSEIIINTILKEENFRIWDMNLRGFAREKAFKVHSDKNKIYLLEPKITRRDRYEKADFAVLNNGSYEFYQVKGISTNNCNFILKDPIIATETQLTRGRVNNHPTQSRLYEHSDFDYLILCLEPIIVSRCQERYYSKLGVEEWEFYKIPTDNLERHHKISNRLKSLQTFSYGILQAYKI